MKILSSVDVTSGAIFRLYMGGAAIISWLTAVTYPNSMAARAAATDAGGWLMWCLLLTGIAAVIDVIINDLLPERYHWRTALRQRHFILSSMAFCYMAQLYVVFYSFSHTGLMLYYMWNAGTIVLTSFLDANQRARDAACATTCN